MTAGRPRDAFQARAEAIACLYASGDECLQGAVDRLQADAEASGLVAEIGQADVQAVMAAAFLAVRPELHSEPVQESGMICDVCDSDPCTNPSFCRASRQADARKRAGKAPLFADAAIWREPASMPSESKPAKRPGAFTFDCAAVLRAVAVLAKHAADRSLTPEIKRQWAREHAALFRFPSALECADHIEHVAAYSGSAEQTVLNVLGIDRVKAGVQREIAA